MLARKRITLTKLISHVLSFTVDNVNKDILDSIFPTQIKSDDEFHFDSLAFGESKNINDFPTKLKSILDPFIKDLMRHGSRTTFDNDINLSLYYSVLSLLIKNYNNLPNTDQLNYITTLRDKLVMIITNNDLKYKSLGWTKKEILNSLVQYKTNKIILKLLADYLCINIFMLNIIEDRIYVISENDYYDIFRPNIFLVYNMEEIFEPLIYSNNPILNYNTSIIKKLVTVDKNFLVLLNMNLTENNPGANFVTKLTDLTDDKQPPNKDDMPHDVDNEYNEVAAEDSDANAYVKSFEDSDKDKNKAQLVFNISNRMKLDELQTIAKKLNIKLERSTMTKTGKTQPKTKQELIDDINLILKK